MSLTTRTSSFESYEVPQPSKYSRLQHVVGVAPAGHPRKTFSRHKLLLSTHRRSSQTLSFRSKFGISELLHRGRVSPPCGHCCDPYTCRYISPAVNHFCSTTGQHTRPQPVTFSTSNSCTKVKSPSVYFPLCPPHHSGIP